MRYRVDTWDPVPPPSTRPVVIGPGPAPPPPPPAKPDLVVTELGLTSTTVKNQGAGAAGPFTLTVGTLAPFRLDGLAPGATATVTYTSFCTSGLGGPARVDSGNEVVETDETNNERTETFVC